MSKSLNEMLAETLISDTASKLKEVVDNKLNNLEDELKNKINKIEDNMQSNIERLECYVSSKPLNINFGTVEKPKHEIVHKKFDTVLKVLQSTKRINKNIMLVGPAGGGKSTLCLDVSKALNLDFYSISVGAQTTVSNLVGFINVKGEYITTPIRDAYENGGVLLIDELDAGNAGVITILNGLLANDIYTFPDKRISKHPNFICMCACNTYGRGADINYVGRNRLDSATLDRFITINIEYDEQLEEQLTNNSDWCKVIRKMRDNIHQTGTKVIISPRASMQGADLLDAGFSIEDVLEMVIFKGANSDTREKIVKNIDFSIFNKTKNKRNKTKKKIDNSEMDYINVEIDFNKFVYSVTNINNDTSIIKDVDWTGCYNIYFSKTNGFSACIDSQNLYLNNGKNNTLAIFDISYVQKFIRELKTYGDKIEVEEQKVLFTIIYGDEKYSIMVG